jgi:hypothetical protein
MPAKEKAPKRKSATARSTFRTILPTDVYNLKAATELLGVRENTLPREIRLRRLRASKRGGRYFILGVWLLQWLESGEIRRPAVVAAAAAQAGAQTGAIGAQAQAAAG